MNTTAQKREEKKKEKEPGRRRGSTNIRIRAATVASKIETANVTGVTNTLHLRLSMW